MDFIIIICIKWLAYILRNDIYNVCVCVFACELLHKVEESDSCDKMDKIFITKQNTVYLQTIPFPLAVKRSNYLGGFKVCKLICIYIIRIKSEEVFDY